MMRVMTLAITAATLLGVGLLLSGVVSADNDRAIPAIGVASPNPGEVSVVWSASTDTDGHKDYRLSWSTATSGVYSWSEPNTDTGGNVHPGKAADLPHDHGPAGQHLLRGAPRLL